MKIFYGVQGTGNGHIARARIMAKELYAAGIEVKFQFTGRAADKYFDMEIFNDYQLRTGLTFNTKKGKVNSLLTVYDAKFATLIRDINELDLDGYDLIISDFEPVSAWAAKKQNKPIFGLGHQYAFHHKVPRAGSNLTAEFVMKYFAPVKTTLGLHWHHFEQPILPPILDTITPPENVIQNKIVVYLPFEDPNEVIKLLSSFDTFQFHVYSAQTIESKFDHIIFYPISHEKFQKDLYDCHGIISNAGFALTSESLQLGKKILVKPLHAQMEQISNTAALIELGYGSVMNELDVGAVENWLNNPRCVQITYPNTAKIITQWIQDGMPTITTNFIQDVWNTVTVRQIEK